MEIEENCERFEASPKRKFLCLAYLKLGDLDKAIDEYERLITFDPDSKDRRLIHPKYYYRLAKLYEERGWPGKAIEHYVKFLKLWKDADSSLSEVKDAAPGCNNFNNPKENTNKTIIV